MLYHSFSSNTPEQSMAMALRDKSVCTPSLPCNALEGGLGIPFLGKEILKTASAKSWEYHYLLFSERDLTVIA